MSAWFWPQLYVVAMHGLHIGVSLWALPRQPRPVRGNLYIQIIASMAMLWVLYMGGFFGGCG